MKKKVVTLGDSGVGKTSLVLTAYLNKSSGSQEATIGAALYEFSILATNGKRVSFAVWDSAGQERYRSMSSIYIRGSHILLAVYDDIQSLKNLETIWLPMVYTLDRPPKIYLVGHKVDKPLKGSDREEILTRIRKQFTIEREFQTSIFQKERIDELFKSIGDDLSSFRDLPKESLLIDEDRPGEGCCLFPL